MMIENLMNYLGNYREKGNELMFEVCPFCKGGRNHDRWKFFLNPEKETYFCQRGKCNQTGHISQLFKHFGLEYKNSNNGYNKKKDGFKREKINNKTYKTFQDNFELINENSKGFKYLQLRGLTKETIKHFKIKKDRNGNIVFPFYQQNKLLCIKYRLPQKTGKKQLKTWQEKGGKAIIFNYNNVNFSEPLIITEGEIDCMCIYQSGFKNVCSIPFGTNNFEWIDLHWDQLKKVPYFIICGDNDKAGKKFIDECSLKLGIDRTKIINNPYNDINEFLYRENEEKLKKLIESAKLIPIDGLINVKDIDKFKIDKENRITTGFNKLNRIIGGFLPGQFVILTGKRGSGKSTFASQLMIEAINTGFNCCVYSGELSPEQFKNWLFLQILGEHVEMEYDDFRRKQVEIVPDRFWDLLNNWIDNKLFIYDNTVLERKGLKEGSILKIFEYAYKRNNCKLFLVDNLMTARNQYNSNKDYYKSQGEFVGSFKQFANDFMSSVIFIAHPKKNDNKGDFENDDVAGSSENTDRADAVLLLNRIKEDDFERLKCNSTLMVKKNRLYGEHGTIKLNFNSKCKQFLEVDKFPKTYIDLKDPGGKPKVNQEILKLENDLPWEVE